MVPRMPLDAVVVLGCRVGRTGALSGAAARRVERAAQAYHEGVAPILVTSGGKPWRGMAEADAFKARLVELGVPEDRVLSERASWNTRQNARFASELCRARAFTELGVVTCDWHMQRALAAFAHFGVTAVALPALTPPGAPRRGLSERLRQGLDRVVLRLADVGVRSVVLVLLAGALLFAALAACRRKEPPAPLTSSSASASASSGVALPAPTLSEVLVAEQTRRAEQIPADAFTASDPALRAAAARALARSEGTASVERLLPLLADQAPKVVAAAAFGLGRACAGREGEIARAIALRAAVWLAEPTLPPDANSALAALAQALGRCANDEAERSLRAWLALPTPIAEASALALGQLGARRGRLDDASFVALLDALKRPEAPVDTALSAFARVSSPPGALLDRLIELATTELAQSGPRRSFAIRALGRANAVAELGKALTRTDLSPAELAEVARELAHHAEAGQRALAAALPRFVPSGEAERRALVERPELPALLALLEAMSTSSPATKEPLLTLARLEIPSSDTPKRRRVTLLRCAAARLLAAGAIAHPELAACDPEPEGRVGKLALLFVLDQGKLGGARGQRFAALARDRDPVVRQAALRLIPGHRELGDAAALLAEALAQGSPGTVATAAEILSAHPDRVDTAPKSGAEKRADPQLVEALSQAYRAAAAGDNIGVHAVLIDAVGALGVLGSMNELGQSCESDNPSLREHAERALRALGQPSRRCNASSRPARIPDELSHLAQGKHELVFSTDAGELRLELDPSAAPVAVTRVLDLVKKGFYDGTVVHRVVPGFLAQLGDATGDGYGAAPLPPLRSELDPTPFAAGDVGMAQGGPDSASSQFFVTLGRFPHLDGESARIGHAGPGWERLVAGDRIVKVRIER